MCRREDIITRLNERTEVVDRGHKDKEGNPSHCWEWTVPTSGNGRGGNYGRISINSVTSAVHRVSYTHYFGYIPGKKQIDHLCNNRRCWHPDHLELVTHLKNQRRRAERSRNDVK